MIRIGIMGAARIAESAMLVPAAARTDVCVTHVAASELDRERAYAAQHGLEPAGGYEALLQRSDIDLVYIALPPSAHRHWTIKALQSGKAVLCEKPFAMNAREASEMVSVSLMTERPLLEAIHYRFHPFIIEARRVISEREVGRIVKARASFRVPIPYEAEEFRWRRELGGGALMDLGCYPIHALRTLLGNEPRVTEASVVIEHGVDAEVTARLRFLQTDDVTIQCGMTGTTRQLDLEITGECGRISISNFVAPQLGSMLRIETPSGLHEEEAGIVSTYDAQLQHVVDVLKHGAPPITGGKDAVANMRLIEAVMARGLEPA